MLSIIVARSLNKVIGVDGDLPWHLPGDLRSFKTITADSTVIAGRTTVESIQKFAGSYNILPNRQVLMLSKNIQMAYSCEDKEKQLAYCIQTRTLNYIFKMLETQSKDIETFVIGGETIYKQFLPYVDRIYLTAVDIHIEYTDAQKVAKFEFDETEFNLSEQSNPITENGITYSFVTYDRIK